MSKRHKAPRPTPKPPAAPAAQPTLNAFPFKPRRRLFTALAIGYALWLVLLLLMYLLEVRPAHHV